MEMSESIGLRTNCENVWTVFTPTTQSAQAHGLSDITLVFLDHLSPLALLYYSALSDKLV
jgi:hypothetical protein